MSADSSVKPVSGVPGLAKLRWFVFAAVAAVLVAGAVITVWLATANDAAMRSDLQRSVRLGSAGISTQSLSRLTWSEEDLRSPDYLAIKAQLQLQRKAHGHCRFVYLLGRKADGAVVIIADSEDPASPDYSPPGQVYAEVSEAARAVFETGKEATEGPVDDRWGSWITALTPVVDAQSGRCLAVFGMDIDAGDWRSQVAVHCIAPISATLLLISLLSGFLIVHGRTLREKQMLEVSEAALRASDEHLNTLVAQRTAALQASEEKFRLIADFTYDWEDWMDENGSRVYISPSCERISGYSAAEFMENPGLVDEIILPEDRAKWHDHKKQAYDEYRAVYELEFRIIKKGGEMRWIHHVCQPVFDSKGVWLGRRDSNHDITTRKDAEILEQKTRDELMRADKMIALGTLVAGIAHEINNPNQFIILNAPSLEEIFSDISIVLDKYVKEHGDFPVGGGMYSEIRAEVPGLIKGILAGSRRIKGIVGSLKGFAKDGGVGITANVDVNAAIRDAVTLIWNLIKNSTDHFNMNLSPELPQIHGNVQQIEQVVINLVQNACHSLQGRNKAITVITHQGGSGDSVVIEVCDEGKGIQNDTLKRIGEPFFTTRRDSGGTGLGLYVTRQIVDAHRGTLEFISRAGQGTTVRVVLPLK